MTRAEIEDIRGVTVSKGTLDVLLETGWIRPRGRRKAPGRPLTFGTTEAFLAHFGLEAIGDLPGLDELKGAGLLDGRLPAGFSVPLPSDDPALREDEDPLEPGDLDLGARAAAVAARGVDSRRVRARPPAIAARLTYRGRHAPLRRGRGGVGFRPRHRAGRDRLAARAVRLRQDDAAAACRRRRAAERGPHPDQRPRGRGRATSSRRSGAASA